MAHTEKFYIFDRSGHILSGGYRDKAVAEQDAEKIRAKGHYAQVLTFSEYNRSWLSTQRRGVA